MKAFNKLRKLITNSVEVINAQKAAAEKTKLGTLRAGSSGAITKEGAHYYSGCGRLAQARFLGFERSPTASLLTMFEGGLALENYIEKGLIASGSTFKKEEPVIGKVGRAIVSGRPDFDILIEGEWVGVEVKSMASPFSAIKQVKNGFPLVKHLVQACTYLLLLKRDKWIVAVGNIFFANERGFKVDPDVRYYEVVREDDNFIVENEKGVKANLPFTAKDIERYYSQLTKTTKAHKLMERPTEAELNMSTYSRCKYCPMSGACNEIENGQIDFEQWMQKVPTSKE